MRRRSSGRAVRYVLLTLYGAFSVVPLVWMVSAAFKRPQDVLTIPIRWVPPVWCFSVFCCRGTNRARGSESGQ